MQQSIHARSGLSGIGLSVLEDLPALLVSGRVVAYAVVRTGRRRGLLMHRVVIVGADGIGTRLAGALLADPATGLHPVGFVDDDAYPRRLPAPLLGDLRAPAAGDARP